MSARVAAFWNWREERRRDRQRRDIVSKHAKRAAAQADTAEAPPRPIALRRRPTSTWTSGRRAGSAARGRRAEGRRRGEGRRGRRIRLAGRAQGPGIKVSAPHHAGAGRQRQQVAGGAEARRLRVSAGRRCWTRRARERKIDERELMESARLLEEKCREFAVAGSVVQIHPGPVVTTFEFKPEAGVKYSKITSLADDLSLAMRAESVLIERMPGKSTVGIQIPNQHREPISLRELLESDTYQAAPSKLTRGAGQDDPRRAVPRRSRDDAPPAHRRRDGHGQVGGAQRDADQHPLPGDARGGAADHDRSQAPRARDVRGDPAPAHARRGRPEAGRQRAHAGPCGRWRSATRRSRPKACGTSISTTGTSAPRPPSGRRTPDEPLPKPLPYIVVVIDELADLMMVARNEVEESVARLAQMARAIGIHLLLATQRPSVDVITGLIKANLPARISFRVSSKVDSRTILDGNGAEQLLGKGDMLFLPPASSRLVRLHGPYISEQETARLAAFLRKQGKPVYDESITAEEKGPEAVEFEKDDLYDEAARIVVSTRPGVDFVPAAPAAHRVQPRRAPGRHDGGRGHRVGGHGRQAARGARRQGLLRGSGSAAAVAAMRPSRLSRHRDRPGMSRRASGWPSAWCSPALRRCLRRLRLRRPRRSSTRRRRPASGQCEPPSMPRRPTRRPRAMRCARPWRPTARSCCAIRPAATATTRSGSRPSSRPTRSSATATSGTAPTALQLLLSLQTRVPRQLAGAQGARRRRAHRGPAARRSPRPRNPPTAAIRALATRPWPSCGTCGAAHTATGGAVIEIELDSSVAYREERLYSPSRIFFDLQKTRTTDALKDATLSFESGPNPAGAPRPASEQHDACRHGRRRKRPVRVADGSVAAAADRHLRHRVGTRRAVRAGSGPRALRRSAGRRCSAAALAPPAPASPKEIAEALKPLSDAPKLPVAAAPAAGTGAKPAPLSAAPPDVPGAAPAAPSANGRGGFSMARQLGLRVGRIVIDAGHGGRDPGAQGPGYTEAALTLDIALRLEKLLAREPGVEVVLTRRTDEYVRAPGAHRDRQPRRAPICSCRSTRTRAATAPRAASRATFSISRRRRTPRPSPPARTRRRRSR